MKLQRVAKTAASTVTLSDGTTILFSYSTPVAACLSDKAACVLGIPAGFYQTANHYSVTTSRHIRAWVPADAPHIDQRILNSLASVIEGSVT